MHDSRRVRLTLGGLLVVALALITLGARGAGGPVRGVRSLGGAVFGFAESAVSSVTGPVAGFFGGGAAAHAQVSALQRQVIALRAQLAQAQLSKSADAQLRGLLQLAGRGGYRIVAANVIAAGMPYQDTVTLDAGRADGITPEETVLNSQGLVGTVTSVTAHTATVLLITDVTAKVGIRMAGSGQIGVVTGTGRLGSGPAQLSLQVFDASAVLQPGQQLVTFGSAGGHPYVPGVPVGVITRVVPSASALTKIAYVRPFADETTLGVVGVVVVPPRRNPRYSVLPPSPPPARPSPGPSVKPSASHAATPRGATASPSPSAAATTGG